MKTESPANDLASTFWDKQKDSVHYSILQTLHKNLVRAPQSILDIGNGSKSPLEWMQAEQKTSIHARTPFVAADVKSITSDFLKWKPESKFQIVTCFNNIERTKSPESFAKKLLHIGRTVIVSVPYKLPPEHAGTQLQTNIDEQTMLEWFGREPNFSYVCHELTAHSNRLVQVYERYEGRWNTLPERNALRVEHSKIYEKKENSPRDLAQFHKPLKECASIDDFYNRFELADASYSIALNDTYLDLEIQAGDSDTIAFFFNGSVDRDKIKSVPCFAMRKISANAQATCVYISDPSLFLNRALTLGWYGGSKQSALQTLLPDIIEFLIEKFDAKRSLFMGSSGGGFASLFYSRHVENALALVANPQTNLKNYYPNIVNRYSQVAFDAKADDLENNIVVDLNAYYKKSSGKNKVVYMQNVSDHHVEEHMQPFLDALNHDHPDGVFSDWLDPSLYLHVSEWSDGHTPPARNILQHLLEKFCHPSFIWDEENIRRGMAEAEAFAAKSKAA